ncbi:gliding motility-associated ABC transporter permease subunit GldF [Myroides odoratus]|uniref:gliding motility-associated ABC transporter permease subunit GldF n=1 Tax=Myroides odoratus TaxID=256 RepID=UPI0039AF0735
MKALCLREIKSFFGSPIGYLVIIVFLIINGLFLWVFDGNYNIPQSGFADLSPFFFLAPWVFLFLIPAVTMRSFSEEIKQGTIELLLTKPLSPWQIVLGKFLGVLALVVLAILPTIVYVWVLQEYILAGQTFDLGSVIGSYLGLVFLGAAYVSMGIFASSLTSNQVVSFILAVLFCLVASYGFSMLDTFKAFSGLSKLGVNAHFSSISKGVIDTRDLLYFISFSAVFLSLTVFRINQLRK